MERLLDIAEADRLADEVVERRGDPAGSRSTSSGKSRLGRQSPYQLGLSAPPRPKNSIIGMSGNVIVGRGHADLHDGAGEVAGEERLAQHLGMADRLDAHVGTDAAGARPDRRDGVVGRRVHGVRGAELLGPVELAVVEVDGDDRRRAGEARAGDRRVADAAAAEDRDAVAAAAPRR